jgi:NitT/TauT family transport system substrate-binding protein
VEQTLRFLHQNEGEFNMSATPSRRDVGLLALAGLAALAPGRAFAADPVKIRIAWSVTPAQLAPIMTLPPGVTQHAGKSYVLDPVRMPGSGATLTALGASELDIAPMTFIQLGPAIHNAGMSDLRIVGDEFRDGHEDYNTNEYMVLKDSDIREVKDLKGKIFATNGIGGGQDVFARVMLRKHGLEYPRDYTIIEATFPTMRAMLAEKKAHLVIGVKPFTEDPSFRAVARTLFTQKEAVGTSDMVFLTARTGYIEKNRAVLVDFFEDYIRATRWFMDPANHEAAIDIVSKYTKVPPQRLGWIFTKRDFYRDPNGAPDIAGLQKNLDMLKDFKFLKSDLDIKKYADLSLIEEAAKRIK